MQQPAACAAVLMHPLLMLLRKPAFDPALSSLYLQPVHYKAACMWSGGSTIFVKVLSCTTVGFYAVLVCSRQLDLRQMHDLHICIWQWQHSRREPLVGDRACETSGWHADSWVKVPCAMVPAISAGVRSGQSD